MTVEMQCVVLLQPYLHGQSRRVLYFIEWMHCLPIALATWTLHPQHFICFSSLIWRSYSLSKFAWPIRPLYDPFRGIPLCPASSTTLLGVSFVFYNTARSRLFVFTVVLLGLFEGDATIVTRLEESVRISLL